MRDRTKRRLVAGSAMAIAVVVGWAIVDQSIPEPSTGSGLTAGQEVAAILRDGTPEACPPFWGDPDTGAVREDV